MSRIRQKIVGCLCTYFEKGKNKLSNCPPLCQASISLWVFSGSIYDLHFILLAIKPLIELKLVKLKKEKNMVIENDEKIGR